MFRAVTDGTGLNVPSRDQAALAPSEREIFLAVLLIVGGFLAAVGLLDSL